MRHMTLGELAVAAGSVAVLLIAAGHLADQVRRETNVQQARREVLLLAEAVEAFTRQKGRFPQGQDNGSASECLCELTSEPASAWVLARLGSRLLLRDASAPVILDPWGVPVRYAAEVARGPNSDRLVTAHGGRPVFISAGSDRDFGDRDPSRSADNIRSDE